MTAKRDDLWGHADCARCDTVLVTGAAQTPCAKERKTFKFFSPSEQLTRFPTQLTKFPFSRLAQGRTDPSATARPSATSSRLYGRCNPVEAPSTNICFSRLRTQCSLRGQQSPIQRSTFYLLSQFSVQLEVKPLPHYSHTPNSLLVEFTSALLQLYNICITKMSAKEAKKNSFLFRGSSVVKMMSSESAKLISCGYILQEIQEAQLSR